MPPCPSTRGMRLESFVEAVMPEKSSIRRIAVDAMGGDRAPGVVIEGCLKALQRGDLSISLVGPARKLRRELGRFRAMPDKLRLVDASEVIAMDEAPVNVLRRKKNSSMALAAQMVAHREADAMVTAGNTGAAWLAAKAALGMIPSIERPALAVILPSSGGQTLLLDAGANMLCKPRHLLHYAIMGSLYAEKVLGIKQPTVGLMSVGEEESKGNPLIREGYQNLSSAGINFIGNVEGRDIFTGKIDVVVTDGFTGNVILKVTEGLGEMVIASLVEEARKSTIYSAGLLMAKGVFRKLRKKVDYSEYGGAPLLGINGPCLVAHGRSSAQAIMNAVFFAASYASSGIIESIARTISGMNIPQGAEEHE